jgi:phosphoribosylformylglycinamidine synthase subunit PurQ / glutaminase
MQPKVIVMAGYGINSEEETLYAFEQSGATGEIVHINDVIDGQKSLDDYQISAFPGGFAYGDDTGSGNAYANKMRNNLWDEVNKFVTQDKLVIGICNGCQILANLGLIPGFDEKYGERQIAMMHNASARFECRWVDLKVESEKCIWTRNMDIIRTPVAHGEGRFFMEKDVLAQMKEDDQIAFRYVKGDGSPAEGEFPFNPNGAIDDVAAMCDPTGRIMGIMPHPERNLFFHNQNDWPLVAEKMRRAGQEVPEEGEGMQMFKNAVEYFS